MKYVPYFLIVALIAEATSYGIKHEWLHMGCNIIWIISCWLVIVFQRRNDDIEAMCESLKMDLVKSHLSDEEKMQAYREGYALGYKHGRESLGEQQ